MAPKRKANGDSVGGSQADQFAKPSDDTKESSAEFAKPPVYLVAARDDDPAAYSVLEIDAAAGGDEPPRVRTVAGLPGSAEPGMSFVEARSKHSSWIVDVGGGLRAGTIIFDPRTLKTFHGPRLGYPKREPVLISHDSEINKVPLPKEMVDVVVSSQFAATCSFVQVKMPNAFKNTDAKRASHERLKAFFSGVEDIEFEKVDEK